MDISVRGFLGMEEIIVLSRLQKGKQSLLCNHSCSWRSTRDEEAVDPQFYDTLRKFVFFGLKIYLASRLDGSSRFVEVWRFGRNSMFKRSS